MELIVTTERITTDPEGRQLFEYLEKNQLALGLEEAIIYYDFPIYTDYESLSHKPDILFLSPRIGFVAIRFAKRGELFSEGDSSIAEIDDSLDQFCGLLIGRLMRSKSLREDRKTLKLDVVPVIIILGNKDDFLEIINCHHVDSYEGFDDFLRSLSTCDISDAEFAEARSVVEGAKALARPQRRIVEDPISEPKGAALAKLEGQIANFDEKQRRTALSTVAGPQRIRGLAGSGKTVILAMKAAHLHMNNPDSRILVTFYTKSLRGYLRKLISRFYRHYRDEDPDWTKIHVRHGWGGKSLRGVYSDACGRHQIVPTPFTEARKKSRNPFDYVCREIVQREVLEPYYDYSLIDEGQDFPVGFYEMIFLLTKGARDKKSIIWAYDELQNILNVKIRSAEELFGIDADGAPRISLARSSKNLPTGSTNDIVLSKCYRNQREVLVIAHALGFGIYGNIVQLLEDEEHWRDVGYELTDGSLKTGQKVEILRPQENSPVALSNERVGKLITTFVANDIDDEVGWIITQTESFIADGLKPDDILVIALDDRHARTYFKKLSSALSAREIRTNNIIADPYSEPPFFIEGMITLSTVYRAKGNEAAAVFAIGIDAINGKGRGSRNKLFTAFTRAKAWLRITGIGGQARMFANEVVRAEKNFPYLRFDMPDMAEIETIQRDLSHRSIKAKEIRQKYIAELRELGWNEDEIDEILSSELKNGDSKV